MSSKSKKRPASKGGAVAAPYPKAPTGGRAQVAVTPAKPERGTLLTAAIALMAVHGVFDTLALLLIRKSEFYNPPVWLWALAFAIGIATVASAVALWYWKRWGLYLYAAASLASIIVGAIVFPSFAVAFYNVIPVAVLGWILTSQKKMALLK